MPLPSFVETGEETTNSGLPSFVEKTEEKKLPSFVSDKSGPLPKAASPLAAVGGFLRTLPPSPAASIFPADSTLGQLLREANFTQSPVGVERADYSEALDRNRKAAVEQIGQVGVDQKLQSIEAAYQSMRGLLNPGALDYQQRAEYIENWKQQQLAGMGVESMDVTTPPPLPMLSKPEASTLVGPGRAANALSTGQNVVAGTVESFAQNPYLFTRELGPILGKMYAATMAKDVVEQGVGATKEYVKGNTEAGDTKAIKALATAAMLGIPLAKGMPSLGEIGKVQVEPKTPYTKTIADLPARERAAVKAQGQPPVIQPSQAVAKPPVIPPPGAPQQPQTSDSDIQSLVKSGLLSNTVLSDETKAKVLQEVTQNKSTTAATPTGEGARPAVAAAPVEGQGKPVPEMQPPPPSSERVTDKDVFDQAEARQRQQQQELEQRLLAQQQALQKAQAADAEPELPRGVGTEAEIPGTVEEELPKTETPAEKPVESVLTGDKMKDVEATALKVASSPRSFASLNPDEVSFINGMTDDEHYAWTKRVNGIRENRAGVLPVEPLPTGRQLKPPFSRTREDVEKDQVFPVSNVSKRAVSRSLTPEEVTEQLKQLRKEPVKKLPGVRSTGMLLENIGLPEEDLPGNLRSLTHHQLDLLTDRVEAQYRYLRKQYHPDVGGDKMLYAELEAIHEELRRRLDRKPGGVPPRISETPAAKTEMESGWKSLPALLTDFGIEPKLRDTMGNKARHFSDLVKNVPDGELMDKWEAVQRRQQELMRTGKATPETSRVMDVLRKRFQAEATKRRMELPSTESLLPMEPSFRPREDELRGPFMLSTVDVLPTEPTTAMQKVQALPEAIKQQALELGLHEEGKSLFDVVDRLANDTKGLFSREDVAAAKWLTENFPHVLPTFSYGMEALGGYERSVTDTNPGGQRVGFVPRETTLSVDVLHEAFHAATAYQLNEPRTPTQRAAVNQILGVMEQAFKELPEAARKFYDEQYRGKTIKTQAEVNSIYKAADEANVREHMSTFYALRSPMEFSAVFFKSHTPELRNWLKTWEYKGVQAFKVVRDAFARLIGLPEKSAAQAVYNAVVALGKEGPDVMTEYGKWSEAQPAKAGIGLLDGILAVEPERPMAEAGDVPPIIEPKIRDRDLRERVNATLNRAAGFSMPRLMAADKEVGNAGVRYASARISAPLVARNLATQVLGKEWKNEAFDRVLGDVVVEDRLRAIKQGWLDAAKREEDPTKKAEYEETASSVSTLIGKEGHALRTEVQYQKLLKEKAITDVLDRFKTTIMEKAEAWHKELGGSVARPGEQTGAFVNLVAILAPEDVESARSMIYGSRRGELTNPLRKGSVFSKQAKGSASEYERSFRTLVERMIRGNYEQKALRDWYTTMEKKGLAVEERPGKEAPRTLGGKPTRKITIEIRGGGPEMTRTKNLWVREDLYDEVRHALAVDEPLIRNSALRVAAQAATELQVVGATDAVFHMGNMMAAITTAQGGKNVLVDMARKLPGVNVLDAAARVVHQGIRIMTDSPEVQKEMANVAESGAWRARPTHESYLQKGLTKAFGEKAKWADPAYSSSRFIKWIDRAGRLALNHMYENMVERGLAEDSVQARREFINRMGQYNERLMPRLDAVLREASLSSFIVAGKNFNRLAFQRFIFDPGVKAATPEAALKMRAIEAAGAFLTIGVVSYVANKLLTGTAAGRAGTPAGAIDTGRDDEHGRPIIIDPLQLNLWRRGLRNTGIEAVARGAEEGLPAKEVFKETLTAIFNGIVHPYAGPAVRTAKIGTSGYDTSGYLVSKNPEDPFENAWASLKNANPMIAAYLRGVETAQEDKGKSGAWEVAKSEAAALGLKTGRMPTMEQRIGQLEKGTQYEGKPVEALPLSERRRLAKAFETEKAEKPNLNEEARRAMAVRSEWRNFAEQDALRARIAPEAREFLDSNSLRLSAFKNELTQSKVQIPLTTKEKQRYEDLVVEQYNERIKAFIPFAKDIPKARLQTELNKRLTLARTRARAKMKASVGQALGPE